MLSRLQLLQKYDVPGPRYTSYPTVPAWKENLSPEDYQLSLQKVKDDESLSLYFHLPFCEKMCHFCGCFKVITKDHSRSLKYVKSLVKEIELVAESFASPHPGPLPKGEGEKKVVSQIHFGGGTPNFIQPDELSLIMQKIRESFEVLPDAEIAIEMHPRTSTKEFCDRLKQEGFNRISLGVQDFNDDVQKLINRHQSFEMTRDMMSYLRELGFENFNFDLIYGLPGQDEEKFRYTLEKTLELNPDRLAVYSYAHVPWKSKIQRAFQDSDLPSPETKLKLFDLAYEFFLKNGYKLIGMDHFAKTDDELFQALEEGSIHRNFMGYSTRADAHQIGFGVSSISYVAGNYFQNGKDIDEYQGASHENQFTTYRGYHLTDEDQVRRDLITELMCSLKVNIPEFEKRHGVSFWDHFSNEREFLKGFEEDELLKVSENSLEVIGQGHLVVRNMAMCFDEYLDEIRKTAKNPVFSRTV